jgi:hypothetical protein
VEEDPIEEDVPVRARLSPEWYQSEVDSLFSVAERVRIHHAT